ARWADWARGRAWFGASTVTGGNVAAVDVELVPETCASDGVACSTIPKPATPKPATPKPAMPRPPFIRSQPGVRPSLRLIVFPEFRIWTTRE
ncbi:hypothetical protein MOV74_23670, partial [Bradyrhizobium sp. SHOUNA76]|nr:hypothetical protein [Bradyrhizobium sp. SHOUNA76]